MASLIWIMSAKIASPRRGPIAAPVCTTLRAMTRQTRVVAVALALSHGLACNGPTSATPRDAQQTVSGVVDLVADAPTPSASAAASTVAGATPCHTGPDAGRCAPGASCSRPGFRCECVQMPPVNCGGAVVQPAPPPLPAWRCEPEDPHATRDDGCPYLAPLDGAACRTEGRVCHYLDHPCDIGRVTATCSSGAWRHPPRLPPPSAGGR